jgi:hypothetical protein
MYVYNRRAKINELRRKEGWRGGKSKEEMSVENRSKEN